jgi:hypothetical protein
MGVGLLAMAIMAYDPSVTEVRADRIATACFIYGHRYNVEPATVAAVWHTESTWRLVPPVSRAGACGPLQVLGGRYGHPGCYEIHSDYRVGVDSGCRALRYWRSHCKERWLDCYNAGWNGKGRYSYGRKVRRVRARLIRLSQEEPP